MKLDLQDHRYLDAAQGWLELGNWHEANEELEQISPQMRAHPALLLLRCQIYSKAKKMGLPGIGRRTAAEDKAD